VRVMAARFPDRGRASAVLDRLRRSLHIEPPDVAIAPLGVPELTDTDTTLLAGRVPDERAPEVARIVRESGGEVVADVDERWTQPRTAADIRRQTH
jgi:hypothetical protein